MAFDVVFAKALALELDKSLKGAKIEKINQPSSDMLVLSLRTSAGQKRLVVSASASSARICFTEEKTENPQTPPNFCILSRKHLTGALIEKVETIGFDRVIEISMSARDELGFECRKSLVCEIMGKYSNIILCSFEGQVRKVTGVLRPVDFSSSRIRQVLPGMEYEAPPAQDKTNPMEETREGFEKKLDSFDSSEGYKFFINNYLGFSPAVSREILYRSCGSEDLDYTKRDDIWDQFKELVCSIENNSFVSCCVIDEDGSPIEFSYTHLSHYGKQEKPFDSFSELLEFYYIEKERSALLKNRISGTLVIVNNAIKKTEKKIGILEDELRECEDADKYRKYGDLLTGSLYMLKTKSEYADVPDYSDAEMKTVRVPLDVKLTPSQNASKYYKKYNKLKSAKINASIQLEKAKGDLSYLYSVLNSLNMCENSSDVSQIRSELILSGYIKDYGDSKKKRESAHSEPLVFTLESGRIVRCGKNNIQNEELTLRQSSKSDIWFHVKNGAGSHVVMECLPDEEPSAEDYTQAAMIAAYYSDMKMSGQVPVDYTRIRYVKKQPDSTPGKVIYTDYYTAYVEPKLP